MASKVSLRSFLTAYLLLFTPIMAHAQKMCAQGDLDDNLILKSVRLEGNSPSLPRFQSTQSIVPCDAIIVPSSFAVHYKKPSKCKVNPITQDNFHGEGKNGIILNKSGKYRLCGNISFDPNQNNVQAITITASDVELDLANFTLSQDLSHPKTGVYGIAIARDVHNVKITGSQGVAEVFDFTLAGIRVMGRTDQITIENIIVSQTAPILVTNDMIPADCANISCAQLTGGIYVGEGEPSGLAFKGTDKNNHVTNLVINHVVAKRCIFGSQIVMTFGMQIDNSSFVENSFAGLQLGCDYPIAGDQPNTIQFPCGADGTIRNCHFDRNAGDNINVVNPANTGFFGSVTGLALFAVDNFIIENCTHDDNFNTFATDGANPDGAHNIKFSNCTFNRNVSTQFQSFGLSFTGSASSSAGSCVGINLSEKFPCKDIVVEYCTAENNQGGDDTNGPGGSAVTGFAFFAIDGARISDCNASGNFCTNAASVGTFGFDMEGSTAGGICNDVTLLRCTAERNGNDGFQIQGVGFQVRSATSNVIFRDCIANGNGQQPGISVISGGFVVNTSGITTSPFPPDTNTANIMFDHCIANGNGNALQPTTTTGGIVLRARRSRPPINNVLIQNCTMNYNRNGLLVIDTSAPSTSITGLVVKNNEADQNTVAGFDLTHLDPTIPVFVTENIAYNNSGGNYLGAAIAPANIVTATSGNLPTAVGFKNLSVTP